MKAIEKRVEALETAMGRKPQIAVFRRNHRYWVGSPQACDWGHSETCNYLTTEELEELENEHDVWLISYVNWRGGE